MRVNLSMHTYNLLSYTYQHTYIHVWMRARKHTRAFAPRVCTRTHTTHGNIGYMARYETTAGLLLTGGQWSVGREMKEPHIVNGRGHQRLTDDDHDLHSWLLIHTGLLIHSVLLIHSGLLIHTGRSWTTIIWHDHRQSICGQYVSQKNAKVHIGPNVCQHISSYTNKCVVTTDLLPIE